MILTEYRDICMGVTLKNWDNISFYKKTLMIFFIQIFSLKLYAVKFMHQMCITSALWILCYSYGMVCMFNYEITEHQCILCKTQRSSLKTKSIKTFLEEHNILYYSIIFQGRRITFQHKISKNIILYKWKKKEVWLRHN